MIMVYVTKLPWRQQMKNRMYVAASSFLACGMVTVATAQTMSPKSIGQIVEKDVLQSVVQAMSIERGTLLSLEIERGPAERMFTIEVPGVDGARPVVVDFTPSSIRSGSYQLVEDRGAEGLVSVDPGISRTVAGVARSIAGATIRGSLLEDGLHAVFRWPDGRIQWIEPVRAHVPGAPAGFHVFYDNDAIPPSGGICGTPAPTVDPEDGIEVPVGPDALAGTQVFCAELACDADYEYYQSYSSSSANVQNRIELIINTSNAQYESQTAIRHEITQILVRTSSNDPYTASGAESLLCQFITEWTNNQASVPRDVAHLFTGRSISGGTIGIAADLGDICDTVGACSGPILYDGAYCLAESDCCGSLGCATDLTTHELGHLWDAFHCDCTGNTMNPFITCSNSFAASSINSIVNHRNSRNCLDVCDGGGGGGGYCVAGASDLGYEHVSALEIPGAGLSNNSGSDGYGDYTDQVATVTIGVDYTIEVTNGDPQWASDLAAMYVDWNADEDFDDAGETVLQFTGVGPYVGTFSIPVDATLGETRMRFRVHDGEYDAMAPCGLVDYGEAEDYGFLIVEPKPNPCPADFNGDGKVDAGDLGVLIGAWGACAGCPADFNGDGQVDAADLGVLIGAWGDCP